MKCPYCNQDYNGVLSTIVYDFIILTVDEVINCSFDVDKMKSIIDSKGKLAIQSAQRRVEQNIDKIKSIIKLKGSLND